MNTGKWYLIYQESDNPETDCVAADYVVPYIKKIALKATSEDPAIIEAQELWQRRQAERGKNDSTYLSLPRIIYEIFL